MTSRQSTLLVFEAMPRMRSNVVARSFSTFAAQQAPPKNIAKGTKGANVGAMKSVFARKKATEGDDATAGPSGNVLSEVTMPVIDLSHLPVFHPELITQKVVGEVMAYPDATMAAFKALALPSLIQKEFAFTRRPSTVVRKSTLEIANLLDQSRDRSSQESRHVIVGPSGSGKSILLLQAISYAQSTKWIVLYLPSATPLINSSTPHSYSATHAIFHQPSISSLLLQRFVGANRAALKSLKVQAVYEIGEKSTEIGESLLVLAERGSDEKVSVLVLEALLEELWTQKTFPVLLAIDDAQSLFATSKYVDPSYHPIESFSLSVPRLLLEFISGSKSFMSGSVLIAPSYLSHHSSPAFTSYIRSLDQSPSSSRAPSYASVYTSQGSSVDVYSNILQGLAKITVPERLERKEAMGVVQMLQYYRGVREAVSDQAFLERYVAADGNPREFVSRGLMRNSTD